MFLRVEKTFRPGSAESIAKRIFVMTELSELMPDAWRTLMLDTLASAEFARLSAFLDDEWRAQEIFPPRERIFTALSLTPPEKVRVVVVGQDPYHDYGQAQGLAFSVPEGLRFPPSLRNIFKELADDVGCRPPESGNLESWARQGVLLINAVLTVRAHQANSHAGKGWEFFTDSLLRNLSASLERSLIFVLWGGFAAKKESLIDSGRHVVLKSAHPSPLSARRGFFGSKPFSKINAILAERGEPPIDWRLEAAADLFDEL